MNEYKATAGPWRVEASEDTVYIVPAPAAQMFDSRSDTAVGIIATIEEHDKSYADSLLIAAAPELRDALLAYRSAVATLTADYAQKLQSVGLQIEQETARQMNEARKLAMAALDKAQGGAA